MDTKYTEIQSPKDNNQEVHPNKIAQTDANDQKSLNNKPTIEHGTLGAVMTSSDINKRKELRKSNMRNSREGLKGFVKIIELIIRTWNKKDQMNFMKSFPAFRMNCNLIQIWKNVYNNYNDYQKMCNESPNFLKKYDESNIKKEKSFRKNSIIHFLMIGLDKEYFEYNMNDIGDIITMMKNANEDPTYINTIKLYLVKFEIIYKGQINKSLSSRTCEEVTFRENKLLVINSARDEIIRDIMSYTPKEIAFELTRIHSELLLKISIHELLNCAINDEKITSYHNLSKFTSSFDKLSWYIKYEILKRQTTDKLNFVKHMIKIAFEFKELNNFHGLFAVATALSGISSDLCGKLNKKKSKFGYTDKLKSYMDYASPTKNFSEYRELLKNVGRKSVIPYIAIFITDFKHLLEHKIYIQDKQVFAWEIYNELILLITSYELLNKRYIIPMYLPLFTFFNEMPSYEEALLQLETKLYSESQNHSINDNNDSLRLTRKLFNSKKQFEKYNKSGSGKNGSSGNIDKPNKKVLTEQQLRKTLSFSDTHDSFDNQKSKSQINGSSGNNNNNESYVNGTSNNGNSSHNRTSGNNDNNNKITNNNAKTVNEHQNHEFTKTKEQIMHERREKRSLHKSRHLSLDLSMLAPSNIISQNKPDKSDKSDKSDNFDNSAKSGSVETLEIPLSKDSYSSHQSSSSKDTLSQSQTPKQSLTHQQIKQLRQSIPHSISPPLSMSNPHNPINLHGSFATQNMGNYQYEIQDFDTIEMHKWLPIHVVKWLKFIKMDEYEETFFINGITGGCLLELTETHLSKMNITKIGHQIIILKSIRQLKENNY